jgi:hypothetical protein
VEVEVEVGQTDVKLLSVQLLPTVKRKNAVILAAMMDVKIFVGITLLVNSPCQ